MGIKTLVRVVFIAGLIIEIGCNRAGDSSTFDAELTLKDADGYAARAYEWLGSGNFNKALKDYDRAVSLKPNHPAFLNGRGFTCHMKGIEDEDRPTCEDRALSDYAEAIRIDPNYASAINNRAWIRATSKVDRCRNGKQAFEEATKACELTGWKNGGYIDTLSVACAEVGDFEQAIRWQRKALENPSYKKEESANAREKLALFGSKQPFRE
jgi:tetratricopeptide (TPR) repeat protein